MLTFVSVWFLKVKYIYLMKERIDLYTKSILALRDAKLAEIKESFPSKTQVTIDCILLGLITSGAIILLTVCL